MFIPVLKVLILKSEMDTDPKLFFPIFQFFILIKTIKSMIWREIFRRIIILKQIGNKLP